MADDVFDTRRRIKLRVPDTDARMLPATRGGVDGDNEDTNGGDGVESSTAADYKSAKATERKGKYGERQFGAPIRYSDDKAVDKAMGKMVQKLMSAQHTDDKQ